MDNESPKSKSYRTKQSYLCLMVFALILLFAALGTNAASWNDTFYPFRVRISVNVPSAGQYVLNVTPQTVTGWLNEKAEFKFKKEYFAFDNVKLVEVDAGGNLINANVSAAYKTVVGTQELVTNGNFEQQSGGAPTGWTVDNSASFVLQQTSHDSSWCMTVQGTNQDRYACWQYVTVNPNTWYRYSSWAKTSPAGAYSNVGDLWWQPVVHTFSDPYIPEATWFQREYFFNTWDKEGWISDKLEVRFERIPAAAADDISIRACQVGLVLNATSGGTKYYDFYYSPLEGITPTVPSQQAASLPSQSLNVTKLAATEWVEDDISYSLPSNGLGGLWYTATTKKVLETALAPSASRTRVSLSCARNESEALQLVFHPTAVGQINSVSATLTGPGGVTVSPKHFDIRRACYVPIHTPSLTGQFRTEQVRSAFTGNLPDPMPKFAPVSFNAGDPNILIWVDISIPREMPAGTYNGQVSLNTSAGVVSVPVECKVWDFVLPERPSCRTSFQLLRYAGAELFPFHKVTERVDKYSLTRDYIAEMARYKVAETNPVSPYLFYTGVLPAFPAEYDVEYSRSLDELNLATHSVSHEAGPLLANATVAGTTPIVTSYYEPLAAHLATKGWLDTAFIQIDEPQPYAFQGVRNFIDAFRLQPHAKDIKMAAYVYNAEAYDALRNHVDILIPANNDAGSIVSTAAIAAYPAGKEVWPYYTMTMHQYLDAPSIDQRLLAPKAWWMGAKGVSTWANVMWWTENENVVAHNPWVDTGNSMSGNGAFAYFYPPDPRGTDLPAKNMNIVPSLRMVLLRDGIDDFEYGTILDKIIVDATARSMDTTLAVQARDRLRRPFNTPVSWALGETYWEQARNFAGDTIAQYKAALGQTEPILNYTDWSKPYDSDPNTRLLLHFDDGLNATTALDSSGNNVHGTLNTGLAAQANHYVVGQTSFGNTLQLNYQNGVTKKVDFPQSEKLGFGVDSLTLEAWICPNSTNTYWTLMEDYTGSDYNWFMGYIGGQMRMGVGWYAAGGWQGVVDSSTNWDLNTWTHAAMTWQRELESGGRNIIRFWKNGVQIFAQDVTNLGTPDPVLGPATVAGRHDGNSGYNFLGKMDELRLSSGIRYGADLCSVGGVLALEGYAGTLALEPVLVQFKQSGVIVDSRLVTLATNPTGYLFDLAPGTYDVEVSASGFLRQVFKGVQMLPGKTATLDLVLKNGDTDGDNAVTSTDLSLTLKNGGQTGQ